VSNLRNPDIANVTKENHIMRDIANATLTGNLTRVVELRPLPSGTDVARLRVASGTRRRSGEEWVERTNYFTVEVYGQQANLCAERLGKGSRVVVDGELDWREWTDQEQNRREAVVLRARQILFERAGSTPSPESEPGERNDSLDGDVSAGAASPAGTNDVRSDQAPYAARPTVRGRAGHNGSGCLHFSR
jgi:single-strand DNA-binding protein